MSGADSWGPLPPTPRAPLAAEIDLFGESEAVQVNHCRMPGCGNFGVPARTEHGKTGPSADRDPNYVVTGTNKGMIPALRCKSCGEKPAMKSNAGVAAEVRRISAAMLRLDEAASCSSPECANHGRSVAAHPLGYRKQGRSASGGQRMLCRACGRRFTLSSPVRLGAAARAAAADAFSRIANKSPVRGVVRGARLPSAQGYYQTLDFIFRRCREFSGQVDRALADGRLRLPESVNLAVDCQTYTLNWISRLDRRNTEIQSICTVDADSQFIFGLHSNYDPAADAFEANRRAALDGEAKEPFRRHPQYWLVGDELHAGRALSKRHRRKDRVELAAQIRDLYARARSRADVEDVELHELNTDYRTPFLARGLQVHLPYLAYAHCLLVRRILSGAGADRVQVNMDMDSMLRAAFLCAFAKEVKAGKAHGFYVRYTKYQTIDEREAIHARSRAALRRFRNSLPPEDRHRAALLLMDLNVRRAQAHGPWRDMWAEHPLPNMNEPDKAACWLTPDKDLGAEDRAALFLQSGIASVDNAFQRTRRLFSALERPVGTSSGHNTVWHGYAPYNPEMVEKYLAIFRVVANFVSVGEDGETPAMRLGFAKQPMDYEDVLWPGQRVPRPKRARRRGRPALGLAA